MAAISPTLRAKVGDAALTTGALVGFCLLAGIVVGTSTSMPDNAHLFVDLQTKTYWSPPCIHKDSKEMWFVEKGLFVPSTKASVRQEKLRPAPACRDEGGFYQEGRSLTGELLEWFGILPQQQPRWNADGTWNW